jgi:hypothetical protein
MDSFLWGLAGGLSALILKDVYNHTKIYIQALRNPRIEVKDREGYIHIIKKPYRWYHKKP